MNIEEKYQQVADILNRHSPAGWKKTWVDAEIKDDHSKETYDYENSSGDVNWFVVDDVDDGFKLTRALRAVRDFMAEQTGDKWKKVRFTLHADGQFNTKFEYDD